MPYRTRAAAKRRAQEKASAPQPSSTPPPALSSSQATPHGSPLPSPPSSLLQSSPPVGLTSLPRSPPIPQPTQDNIESRLLDLAPELRNSIYRYTLLEAKVITITLRASTPKEPGLLRTCRQIRQEALSIWLLENKFLFYTPNFHATRYITWCHTSEVHRKVKPQFSFKTISDTKVAWKNLLVWIEAYYNCEVNGCLYDSLWYSGDFRIAGRIAGVAIKLKKEQKMPWEKVKEVLEEMRAAVALNDHHWAASPD